MKRFINKIRDNKLYIASFIVASIVICVLYLLNHVTPFGDRSLLCVDFFHQYGPMLGELYDRMHGAGDGFIYSFNMGLGLPFFRNFLNYLSSPFNILMMLFPRKGLLTSYSLIIGIKAVSSCVTMVYYLSKKFKTKELYLLPLGLIYAFSAYYTAYYWNIMWLDGMVFLPLITLGIENIVNNNKWKFYSIFLAIMLVANYFIGYMICIFSVVYFIIYLLYKFNIRKNELLKSLKEILIKCLIFGMSSLVGGMLTFALLLPMATSMESISATGSTMPTTQYYKFELIDFLKGHLSGVKITTFASDEITNPNISCGILSVALLFLYILNLEIPIKNKIFYLLGIGFFISAFFIPQLDFILQAFHVPNDLPYRYSFIYSFLLVLIGAYSLMNIKKMKFPIIAIGYIILMLILVYISSQTWASITTNMIYINMILLTLYFIFYSGIYFLKDMKEIFYIALIIITAVDVSVGINYNWNITQDKNGFYEDYKSTEELLKYVKDYEKNENSFYRIENINTLTLNDGSWYNYPGVTTFSSMAYENMAVLQHNLGLPSNYINSYKYIQNTPIYDLMFNVKYFIGNTNDNLNYVEIKTIDETANEFIYNVGLGFGVNKKIENWDYTNSNPYHIQNDFIYKATGLKDILKEANIINAEAIHEENETIIKYTVENTFENLFFYTKDSSIDFVLIGSALYYKNDVYSEYTELYDELSYSYLEDYNEENSINIASQDEFIYIYVGYNNYIDKNFYLYRIDEDAFINAANVLKSSKLDITSFNENKIEGNIYLNSNMDIYTSIPYDEGWHAYLDGKEVKTYPIGNALLGIEGTRGHHTLKLKYKVKHFYTGLSCSIFALLIIIFDILKDKKIIEFNKKKLKN